MGGLFCDSSSIRGKVSIEIDRPFQLRGNGSLTGSSLSHSKKVERPGGGSNISIFFHGKLGYRLPDVDLCSAFHKGRLKIPELVRHRFRTALSKVAQEVVPTQPFLSGSAGFGQTHRQTHKAAKTDLKRP